MKNIFIMVLAAMIIALNACKKEEKVTIASTIGTAVIASPVSGASLVVTPADSAQNMAFVWSKANYGVNAVLSYFVQIDSAGNNFKKVINISTKSGDSLNMTNGSFNNLLLAGLGLAPNATSSIEIRVGSTLSGKDTVYSKVIPMTVTTFKQLAPSQLYVPGAYEGWNPAAAPMIYPVTTFAYEGFVFMNKADYFKFTSAPDWAHINYGDAGNGSLSTDGNAAGLKVNAAGYYKLNADIKNLTYSATLINTIGIIGTATPQGWNGSTAMTYDQVKGTWSVTVNLVAGALKFRANDAWAINYGPADVNALTGTLIQTNDAVTINTAGAYTVTIDMSQSTQKKYIYTIVKN